MVGAEPKSEDRTEVVNAGFLEATEAKMRASFLADAGLEARLVDTASALLVRTLESVPPGQGKALLNEAGEPVYQVDRDRIILAAMSIVGTKALRVIRAARAVLASGFESEAGALDRILVELMAHRRAILDDPTASEALAWLRRERKYGISKRVAAMGSREVYENLCVDAHGDPEAVLRLRDPETNTIELGPQRGSGTRASLLLYAGFARDHAGLVAQLSDTTSIQGMDRLDAGIDAAWQRLKLEFGT